MRGRTQFNRYKDVLNFLSKLLQFMPFWFRKLLWTSFANIKGKYGMAGRYIIIKALAANCGSNVAIYDGAYIKNAEKIDLGSNVSIHPMCYIDAIGGLEIGSDVSIAHGVTIMTSTHTYEVTSVPIKDQEIFFMPVTIADDVWLGAKSTILGGVSIGKRSIVAACAVVNKDVAPGVVVAGVPAKVVKRI